MPLSLLLHLTLPYLSFIDLSTSLMCTFSLYFLVIYIFFCTFFFFFFNDTATTEIYTLSLHDALPIFPQVMGEIQRLSQEAGLRVANVFHAGDGNLHPLVLYDRRVPGQQEAAETLSARILELCIEAGGSITREHGVGVAKKKTISKMFAEAGLGTIHPARCAFDPLALSKPTKLFPRPLRFGLSARPVWRSSRAAAAQKFAGGIHQLARTLSFQRHGSTKSRSTSGPTSPFPLEPVVPFKRCKKLSPSTASVWPSIHFGRRGPPWAACSPRMTAAVCVCVSGRCAIWLLALRSRFPMARWPAAGARSSKTSRATICPSSPRGLLALSA